jgi:hypothetical protein
MSLFERFSPKIRNLWLSTVTSVPVIPDAFYLAAEGILKSHYIPFDHVNAGARIVIVGITPGFWATPASTGRPGYHPAVLLNTLHLRPSR